MTTLDVYPQVLEEAAAEAVHQYADTYDAAFPITMDGLKDVLETGPLADREEARSYMNEVGAFYAEELDVDAEYVDELWAQTRYAPSLSEFVQDTASPFSTAAGMVGAGLTAGMFTALNHAPEIPLLLASPPFQQAPEELALFSLACGAATALSTNYLATDGQYDPVRDRIGVGCTEREGPRTFWTVAAETYHGYQYAHDSPTKNDPLLTEGSERAASTKALEHKAAQEDGSHWQQAADAFRGFVLARGYAQYHAFTGAREPADALQDIGLAPLDAELMVGDLDGGDAEYNFGAATILSLDDSEMGPALVDVFHGEYDDQLDPYRDRITPSHRAKYGMKEMWENSGLI